MRTLAENFESPDLKMDTTSVEGRVLLCSVRAWRLGGAGLRNLVEREAIDWRHFKDLTVIHSVVPLAFAAMKRECRDLIPTEIYSELEQEYRVTVRRNLLLWSNLVQLVRLLEAHGIPTIPWKGPSLELEAYGQIGLRQFGDIDVLIRPKDVEKAFSILSSAGYRRLDEADADDAFSGVVSYADPSSGAPVEVHWALGDESFAFPLDVDGMFDRSRRKKVNGVSLLRPSDEEMLLMLCAHGCKHCWKRLSWICDIGELLRSHPEIDCSVVALRAEETGAIRMVSVGCVLAWDLLGVPLPESSSRHLCVDKRVRKLARHTVHWTLNGNHGAHSVLQMMWDRTWVLYLTLGFRERFSDGWRKLRSRLRISFSPNQQDREWVHLPAGFRFLYYILRPIRLVGVYGLGFRRKEHH